MGQSQTWFLRVIAISLKSPWQATVGLMRGYDGGAGALVLVLECHVGVDGLSPCSPVLHGDWCSKVVDKFEFIKTWSINRLDRRGLGQLILQDRR